MATRTQAGGKGSPGYPLLLVNNPPDWSPAQAWAYALGAPYHAQHRMPLNALPQLDSQAAQSMTTMLKRDWSIEGDEDLVRTLNWLGTEGHRRPHGLKLRRYSLLRRPAVAARREELREAGQEDQEALAELWRLDAVQANTDNIRGGLLIGFDAARAVMVARAGWVLGWLPEAHLWDYLLDMACDVQRRFTSWADYAADYRLSRNMWRAANAPDHFDAIVEQLLTDASSPWRRLPWSAPGLDAPRPARVFDRTAPVWSLERWDD